MKRSVMLPSLACLTSHANRIEKPLRMWIRNSGIESNDPLRFLSTGTNDADLLSPEWAMRLLGSLLSRASYTPPARQRRARLADCACGARSQFAQSVRVVR